MAIGRLVMSGVSSYSSGRCCLRSLLPRGITACLAWPPGLVTCALFACFVCSGPRCALLLRQSKHSSFRFACRPLFPSFELIVHFAERRKPPRSQIVAATSDLSGVLRRPSAHYATLSTYVPANLPCSHPCRQSPLILPIVSPEPL